MDSTGCVWNFGVLNGAHPVALDEKKRTIDLIRGAVPFCLLGIVMDTLLLISIWGRCLVTSCSLDLERPELLTGVGRVAKGARHYRWECSDER
ncbi:hypothetical protein ACLOJK_038590 [Asimina triloba]